MVGVVFGECCTNLVLYFENVKEEKKFADRSENIFNGLFLNY